MGDPPEVACERYLVTRRSFDNWLKQGEEHVANGLETPEADFFLRVKRAIARFMGDALANVRAGAPGWQGEAWALERRGREYFARPVAIELTGKDGGPVRFDPGALTDEQLERIVRADRTRTGGGGA